MRILHTADLHLGQVLYQNYDRVDEHDHFFDQLKSWCINYRPDALLVSGDVFDIQQVSAAIRERYTHYFVSLNKACPQMSIIITAGNHDSAARLQADHEVWDAIGVRIIGAAPSMELMSGPDGWQHRFIVNLPSGYVIALPYMIGERKEQLQSILDTVAKENAEGKPVVMMGHLAVCGADATGHGFDLTKVAPSEIGRLAVQDISMLGSGYDYLALGHIHKPQTLGHPDDVMLGKVTYPAGVARYSGSALHVSCDETYPHTVSVVDIDKHGGEVTIEQVRINELRHFYVLPEDGSSYHSADEALSGVKEFAAKHDTGYFRLRMDYGAKLPADFHQQVYSAIEPYKDEIRYNPKTIWIGAPEADSDKEQEKPTFEIAELQQMTDPLVFIEKTIQQYPDLDLEDLKVCFSEVEKEMKLYNEEAEKKGSKKSKQD